MFAEATMNPTDIDETKLASEKHVDRDVFCHGWCETLVRNYNKKRRNLRMPLPKRRTLLVRKHRTRWCTRPVLLWLLARLYRSVVLGRLRWVFRRWLRVIRLRALVSLLLFWSRFCLVIRRLSLLVCMVLRLLTRLLLCRCLVSMVFFWCILLRLVLLRRRRLCGLFCRNILLRLVIIRRLRLLRRLRRRLRDLVWIISRLLRLLVLLLRVRLRRLRWCLCSCLRIGRLAVISR